MFNAHCQKANKEWNWNSYSPSMTSTNMFPRMKMNHLRRNVQFSRSVVSDSLRPHESQHARPPCPSPTPGVHSDSHPSSRWCHPTISSSVVPFSSCPQSLPASESFPMSQLFARGGQSIRVSALASVLPKDTQDWSPLGWTGWTSLQSKGLKSLLQHHSSKASILQCSAFFAVQLSHPYMTTGKTIALTRRRNVSWLKWGSPSLQTVFLRVALGGHCAGSHSELCPGCCSSPVWKQLPRQP